MVYGGIQIETCLANDISRFPDLGPKDELVGYSTEACDGLRSVLFSTNVYQSAGLIQIDGMCDEIIVGRNELFLSSFNLIKWNDVRTL